MMRLSGKALVASLLFAVLFSSHVLGQEASEESVPAEEHFLRGSNFANERKLSEAAAELRLAVEKKPDYVEAYGLLAKVYSEMGETGEAVATYEALLQITPEDCATWMRSAGAHRVHAGRAKSQGGGLETEAAATSMQNAVKAYERVIELCPETVLAYDGLGEIHVAAGRYDEAARVFGLLLEKDPTNAAFLSRIALLHRQDENWEQAASAYERLLAIDSTRVYDRMIYGHCLKKMGRFEDAAGQYLRVIESDPARKDVYCNLCFLYVEAKNGQKAVETAMKAIGENAPNQACLTAAWGKGCEIRADKMVREEKYDNAISQYEEAKVKFQTIQIDSTFGEYSTKQIDRLSKLIEMATSQRERAKQEGTGNE